MNEDIIQEKSKKTLESQKLILKCPNNYRLERLAFIFSILYVILGYFSVKLGLFKLGKDDVIILFLAFSSMATIAFSHVHFAFRKYTRLEIDETNHVQFYRAGRCNSFLELKFELNDIEDVRFQKYYFDNCVRLIITIRRPLMYKWGWSWMPKWVRLEKSITKSIIVPREDIYVFRKRMKNL